MGWDSSTCKVTALETSIVAGSGAKQTPLYLSTTIHASTVGTTLTTTLMYHAYWALNGDCCLKSNGKVSSFSEFSTPSFHTSVCVQQSFGLLTVEVSAEYSVPIEYTVHGRSLRSPGNP